MLTHHPLLLLHTKANAEPGSVYGRPEHVTNVPPATAAATTALHGPAGHEPTATAGDEPEPAVRPTGRSAAILASAGHATEPDESDGSAELGHAVQQLAADAARNGASRSAEQVLRKSLSVFHSISLTPSGQIVHPDRSAAEQRSIRV